MLYLPVQMVALSDNSLSNILLPEEQTVYGKTAYFTGG
jgi:hypothetical protein